MELSIGKNIQYKRKTMGLTQEQLATAVGVSVAAVSKWETGAAYPDITLLSPIARLLDSTLDDLLGFEPQQSKEQVMEICDKCARLFESSDYDKALALAERYLREYPNNPLLKLKMGSTFMMHVCCTATEENAANLLNRAEILIKGACKSEDTQIRDAAWHSLSALLIQQDRYEDALKAIDHIHSSEIDPNQMKVSIYYALGDYKKSKQAAQSLLASHSFGCDIAIHTLAKIAKAQKNFALALRMEKLSLQLSQMFDKDKLYGQNLIHYLMIAECYAQQKKSRETLDALHEFAECAQMPVDLDAIKSSPFFDSIEMHKAPQSFLNRYAGQMIAQNPAFAFLHDHKEYLDILNALEQLPES